MDGEFPLCFGICPWFSAHPFLGSAFCCCLVAFWSRSFGFCGCSFLPERHSPVRRWILSWCVLACLGSAHTLLSSVCTLLGSVCTLLLSVNALLPSVSALLLSVLALFLKTRMWAANGKLVRAANGNIQEARMHWDLNSEICFWDLQMDMRQNGHINGNHLKSEFWNLKPERFMVRG